MSALGHLCTATPALPLNTHIWPCGHRTIPQIPPGRSAQAGRQQGLDLTHFPVARVTGELFPRWDLGSDPAGSRGPSPRGGCESPGTRVRCTSPQPFLATPLTASHLEPGQTLTAAGTSSAAPTCLAGPGQGAQAQLPWLAPWLLGAALGWGPEGPSHRLGFPAHLLGCQGGARPL